jgi:hypothetical protein
VILHVLSLHERTNLAQVYGGAHIFYRFARLVLTMILLYHNNMSVLQHHPHVMSHILGGRFFR